MRLRGTATPGATLAAYFVVGIHGTCEPGSFLATLALAEPRVPASGVVDVIATVPSVSLPNLFALVVHATLDGTTAIQSMNVVTGAQ